MNQPRHGRHVVVTTVDRADAAVVDELAPIGTATVHEAIGRRGFLGPELRPIQQGARVAGTAVTVLSHPGDNLMIHAAVEVVEPGDILVVALTSPAIHGMFGDLLAASLMARGCAGLVIDSAVRDIAELNEMGFPVWARAVHAEGTVKATPGHVNVPIHFAGRAISPGDVVVADADGVVVVERERAAEVAAAAEERIANEETSRARLEAGELGLDFYGLRQKLEDLGVHWVDEDDR